ncbi:MAG: haloacid dehalogenase type II [Caldilineaceae bacterium]
MAEFRPKYITFDCYGTLIDFQISTMTRTLLASQIDEAHMPAFLADFSAYRFDEALGAWQPYADLIQTALHRCCQRWGLPAHDAAAQQLYAAIPNWGPHPDVPAGLAAVAKEFPLVILSNAADHQIHHNVAKLGAPFHGVYTAEQAQAYKPRLRAFEYMIDQLRCNPADLLHVSSSLRYDLMSAYDVGIRHTVYIERGHGPSTSYYGYPTLQNLGGLATLVGVG